jgi:hypothetical protein
MPVDKREVLRNIEGDYLLDYAVFTGAVRGYVTQGLEEHFAKDKNDIHRRMFLLAVFREEYSAYEDLGAMLNALLSNRRDPVMPLLEQLISYGVGQVALAKVMERFAIASSEQLCQELGLLDLVPVGWEEQFPRLDLARALRAAADFFFVDCTRNQKRDGLRAFNKLKHGLLLVPKATLYMGQRQIDAPAALFETEETRPEASDNPISLYAVPMGDGHLDARLRAIHFVQINLRMIAALLVVARYPCAIQRRGITAVLDLFRTSYMIDVTNFIDQVTSMGNAANAG